MEPMKPGPCPTSNSLFCTAAANLIDQQRAHAEDIDGDAAGKNSNALSLSRLRCLTTTGVQDLCRTAVDVRHRHYALSCEALTQTLCNLCTRFAHNLQRLVASSTHHAKTYSASRKSCYTSTLAITIVCRSQVVQDFLRRAHNSYAMARLAP